MLPLGSPPLSVDRSSLLRRRWWTLLAVLVTLAASLPAFTLASSPATAAVPGEGVLTLTKEVQGEPVTPTYGPGETFIYALRVSCSNLDGPGCGDAAVVDQLPDPLVVDPAGTDQVQVTGVGTAYDVTAAPGGTQVAVRLTQPLGGGEVGLESGDEVLVLVRVRVPADASSEYAGTVVNTARVTQSNGDPRAASTPVVLDIEETLQAAVAKTVTSAASDPVPAVPGQEVTWTARAGNSSNGPVDAIVLQDPADGAPDPYEYLALTGFDTFTPPTGADRVRVDHRTAAGTWVPGTVVPVPADPAALLPADLATVHGLRFTFTASTGRLPATGDAGRATVTYRTETRASVTSLPANTTVTVVNRASARVTSGGTDSPVVTAQATIDMRRQPPTVALAKEFSSVTLTAGQSTVATLRATVGASPVSSLVLDEPVSGPDLEDQGLSFDGFTPDLEWPPGATGAAITYRYADGVPEPAQTTAAVDTLPGPTAGRRVVGFRVEFAGTMARNTVAVVPFTVVADAVSTPADVTTTNTAGADVTGVDGQVGTPVTASDDLTRRPERIDVTTAKRITQDWVYAVPGAASLVSLPTELSNTGAGAATVGSTYLEISDPAAPATAPSAFWDHFDLRSVGPTEIPADGVLTVSYWDGVTWTPFVGATSVPGPVGSFSFTPTAAERAAAQGVRFRYTPPTPGGLLPPGFEVIPYLRVQLRDTLRSDPSTSALPAADLDLTNDVLAETGNPVAVDPVVTDTGADAIEVRPVPSGPGLDLVNKTWLTPAGAPGTEVVALTDDERTARLSWSTQNLPMTQVILTDPATAPNAVADSVYDAFDLRQIEAIADPLMRFDQVSRVEFYSAATDAWVDVTAQACPGTACDGAFPGYTLTTAQQADTLGVRLTFDESPTRASRITGPDDPDVGSGVAASGGNGRLLDLVMRLRQDRRSTGEAVLGDQQGPVYNGTTAGEVVNTVDLLGTAPGQTWDDSDEDEILIVDRPVNIEVTKTFDQTVLGLPPTGTAPADYPLVTADLQVRSDSASKLRLMELEDAVNAVNNPFGLLNLHQIEVVAPAGATGVTVYLTSGGPGETAYTEAEAEALTAAQLIGVTAVRVQALGLMATDEVLRAQLTFQLRAVARGPAEAPVTAADQIDNTARGRGLNPGDSQMVDVGTSVDIAQPTYDVVATKTITPASRTEVQPRTGYTVALTGQPSGTVRTRLLTMADASPTFWNGFDLTSFPAQTVPEPVEQLRLDVLTGVTYTLEGAGGTDLVARCGGSLDLTACWRTGSWTDLAGGSWTPDLPAGVAAGDVRGVRVLARRADGRNWERPANPEVPFRFTAERRELLRVGPDGGADTPVPSTKPDLAPAPGESARGTFTDAVDVHLDGAWQNQSELWTADDRAQATTRLTHLPNRLAVSKAPGNGTGAPPLYAPATPIPYVMTFENTGSWPQTGLRIVDDIGANDNGSFLVWPADPDTGAPAPSYSFTLTASNGTAKPTVGFAATLDVAAGRLDVTVPAGFVLQPGDKLELRANLVFQLGLEPGTTVVNVVRASTGRILDTCLGTRNNRPVPAVGPAAGCVAETVVEPSPLSPIRAVKAVRGLGAGVPGAPIGGANYDDLGVRQLDASGTSSACESPNARNGFYRYPCTPITRAGGAERWQMSLTNEGNIPVARLAAIDVLPRPGDTGTILNAQRRSQWRPIFLGNARSNVDDVDSRQKALRVYYTTDVPSLACNAADIRNEVIRAGIPASDPCYADVNARTWSLLTPGTTGPTLASARAVKVVIDYDEVDTLSGLAPGRTIDLTFDTQTPAYAPTAVGADVDPVAYNSFAVASLGTFQGDDAVSSVVEPRKVGVALSTGRLRALKELDVPTGTSFPLPTSYAFDLSCTSQGEDVPLVDAEDDPVNPVRLTPGQPVTINDGDAANPWGLVNIPRYADCRLTERGSQGAEVTFDPAASPATPETSGDVVAVRDYATRDDVANPAYPTTLTPARITASNAYAVAGLTVSKTVDTSGAVDEDGDPVTYDQSYAFTASCTFNGTDVVPAADRSFTLTDGQSKTFDALPAGAECTVTETGAGSAARTTHVVTEDGTIAPSAPGTSAQLTLGADVGAAHVNAIGFTNVYTVGSLHVTKEVLGLGADWAGNEFRILVTCTHPDAATNPVFDGERIIEASDPVWEITELPTGAECTVTEDPTQDGGATLTVVYPTEPVTIGTAGTPGDPVEVGVYNGFGAGDLRVTKQVDGDTAELPAALTGTYTVSVACTFEINGVDVPLAIPGGATRTLTGDGATATYSGLPTNAECAVTETDQDPVAQQVTITPAQVSVGVNTTVDVEVRNTFELGSVEVVKTVSGPGAELYGAGPFALTLACTVEDGAGVDVPLDIPGGATRTLAAPGLSTRYELLPVGADCRATETADGGAASTRVTVTPQGGAPVSLDGPTAELTVLDDAASGPAPTGPSGVVVGLDNRFDVGAVRVTKRVTGPGAETWGPGPFQVELTCTMGAGQTPVSVPGGGVRDLSADNNLTTEYDDLPPGADCRVEETRTAGATSSTVDVRTSGDVAVKVDGTVADLVVRNDTAGGVSPGPGIDVRLTNRYQVGAVRVIKELAGPGAAEATGPFEVTLGCTRDIDGKRVAIDAPSGAVLKLDIDGQLRGRWTDLPVGARCEVTETDDGGAARSVVSPSSFVVDDDGPVTVTVRNTFGPPDPDQAGDQAGGDDGSLADTGATVRAWWLLVAGGCVLAGAALLVASRRRSSTSRH